MQFNPPVFVESNVLKRKKKFIRLEAHLPRDSSFLFQTDSKYTRSNGVTAQYWRCIGCFKCRREQPDQNQPANIGRITTSGEPTQFESDPLRVQHHPLCHPILDCDIDLKNSLTEARKQIRAGNKRPRHAYDDMVLAISEKHPNDEAKQNEIKLSMEPYERIE